MLASEIGFFSHEKVKFFLRGVMLICIALFTATTQVSAADGDVISVVFPDIKEPYRSIFEQIIEGVEEKVGKQVDSYPVGADTSIEELKDSLQHQNTKALIALGRQGLATATALNNNFIVVVGGILTVPDSELQHPVINLTPDPELLFARMKLLQSSVKRVFVVFNPDNNSWLMRYAQDAARVLGLKLVMYEAKDLRTAVAHYQKFFDEANGLHDALWLPQDNTTVEGSTVLPLVLRESWDKGIPVFSSNASHVRRGILYSLFPDNVALGRSLASLVQDCLSSVGDCKDNGMSPLRDVKSVINRRTAKHLRIKSNGLNSFDTKLNDQ